jgi:SPP1 family predicted phage head-tail adaptor
MKPTPAGKLRHRITIQTKTDARNTVGEQTTWADVLTCWASLDVLTAKLIYSTDDFISDTTYLVVIRYPGSSISINVNDHIICKGTTFEIQAVNDPELRHIELHILCHVINGTA